MNRTLLISFLNKPLPDPEDQYGQVAQFYMAHGRLPCGSAKEKDESNLGNWLNFRRGLKELDLIQKWEAELLATLYLANGIARRRSFSKKRNALPPRLAHSMAESVHPETIQKIEE